jgi:hypothetical protein
MPVAPPRLASGCSDLKFPKGQTRAEKKGSLDYRERSIITRNRARCERRDGECRIGYWKVGEELFGECYGASEWNHFDKRSLTMGEDPEERHATSKTGMLCASHHRMVDAHEIKHEALTEDGLDGPMAFWVDDSRRLVEHEMPKPRWGK